MTQEIMVTPPMEAVWARSDQGRCVLPKMSQGNPVISEETIHSDRAQRLAPIKATT